VIGAISWLRIVSAVGLAVLLASSHWWVYVKGKHQVQLEWDADTAQRTAAALVAEQQSRATEQALNDKVRKVANDYNAEKRRRLAADSAAADSLRRLEAALAAGSGESGRDPAATARADDDPRNGIIAECAGTVTALDRAYRALADQTQALQQYTAGVCLKPQP